VGTLRHFARNGAIIEMAHACPAAAEPSCSATGYFPVAIGGLMLNKLFGSMKNDRFNQAKEQFQNLRNYESGSSEYVSTILEVIRLCQMAIQGNKNDGDAHVLLANTYLLAALSCTFGKGYPYFLAKAAAVIQVFRTGSMYIKNRDNAEKVYGGIVEQLTTQMPDWVEGVQRLSKDMNELHQVYYSNAINPSSLIEIKTMLTSE